MTLKRVNAVSRRWRCASSASVQYDPAAAAIMRSKSKLLTRIGSSVGVAAVDAEPVGLLHRGDEVLVEALDDGHGGGAAACAAAERAR